MNVRSIALESLRERDKRMRRERFLQGVISVGWWIVTHTIAFAVGAFVIWMVIPAKAAEKVVTLTHVIPADRATLARTFDCTKGELIQYREFCRRKLEGR